MRIDHFIQGLMNHHWKFLILGFLAALAWAPYHHWFFAVFSFLCLILTGWKAPTWRQAWIYGWWWGWGLNMGTLYWIGHALWVDSHRFAWLWPGVVFGLPALLALYPSMVMGLGAYMRYRCKLSIWEYSILFPILWSMMEWIQGHAWTGFPWNLTAYIWGNSLPMTQMVAFLGSYGWGFLTVLWISVMAGLFLKNKHYQGILHALCVGVLGWILVFCIGQYRLAQHPTQFHPNIYLRCVQPVISQKEKTSTYYAESHWQQLLQWSFAGPANPSYIIWPEGCFPWCMSSEHLNTFPDLGSVSILFGSDYQTKKSTIQNALLVYLPQKILQKVYAKRHLVPGGEYFPFRKWFEYMLPAHWLQKITPGSGDFEPGNDVYSIALQGLPPFRCLICYESIFPGTVRYFSGFPNNVQPEWILNITNDGWFGTSAGPYQHFLSSRFRAIEEGLPLVRAANTGISAIVDPVGRIIASLPLYYKGVLDGPLPCAISTTFYGIWQDHIWIWMIVLSLSILLALRLWRCVYDR